MIRSSQCEPEFRLLMTVKAYQQSLKEANLLPKFNVQYKHQCNVGSAPCKAKGIRIPDSEKFCVWNAESRKILLVESRTMGFGIRNTAQGIHNLTNDWNLESKFHHQGTGIAGLESGIHGVKSAVLDNLGFPYMG